MSSNSDVSTRRRVKLYMLNEERQWDDKGTGHVSATIVENNSMALVVTSETDGSRLLESKIQHDTAYQKQQETLIVWSEGDNMDLALSFQEKTGCDDIWEKICNVQGKDPSVDITQDLIDDADDPDDMEMDSTSSGANAGFEFPICDLNHLLEISEMFTQVVSYPIQRERLATALERSQYLKQLVDLFHKAEDLDDQKSLHHLYEIMRAIVQFNRRNLYELIFSDEMMMDTVGILEYNPHRRVRHREFLLNTARFREVFPMSPALRNKIQQTYRVQYIQDSCMPPPSLFDDNAGSSLNSFVYLNKIDIVTKLQEDAQFSSHLFHGLSSLETSPENRRDLLCLLKEFCSIINSLQPSQKESFFSFLSSNRALKSIFISFKLGDDSLKAICIDIIQIFIENQASMVREFFIADSRENSGSNNNSNSNEGLALNQLIDHMIHDLDPELSNGFVITNMLKLLIDPENMINSSHKNEKQEFLNFFYKCCISHLTKPLIDLTIDNELKYDDYHSAMVMHNIVEILAFCVEFHSYNMKNYAFHNNLLLRVVALFKSRHKFLVLAALRVVRKFVSSKEEFNYRYMIKNNILGHVVALLDNNKQYNMLNSAILELFEFIRTENINCLLVHAIEHYWHSSLQHHSYVPTFQLMKSRYDSNSAAVVAVPANASSSSVAIGGGSGVSANKTSSPGNLAVSMFSLVNAPNLTTAVVNNNTSNTTSHSNSVANHRLRRDARSLDEDEEQWYDQDDDEDDDDPQQQLLHQQQMDRDDCIDDIDSERERSSSVFVERRAVLAAVGNNDNNNNSSTNANVFMSGGGSLQHHLSHSHHQQIPINIKSTSIGLGLQLGVTVSSSTNCCYSNNNSSNDIESDNSITNGDIGLGLDHRPRHNKLASASSTATTTVSADSVATTTTNPTTTAGTTAHQIIEPSCLTGLVDYSSDDEEEAEATSDATITTTTISSNTSNASSNNSSKDTEWSSVSSPKRLKID